ncbi:unnamed protein product [Phytophthora lilii]|uniref:Unnamed protein product n=1 Tax=Phytophthora lilii TaxID=2077276 RepID=A0A9W6YKN9_9STRA|nr:unnamed protein product [Phytophthora lilii]
MTKNPVNHGRAKHIDIKYQHIRDEVKRGEVKLEYCETSIMLADIMTKTLPGPCHMDLTASLGLRVAKFWYRVPVTSQPEPVQSKPTLITPLRITPLLIMPPVCTRL